MNDGLLLGLFVARLRFKEVIGKAKRPFFYNGLLLKTPSRGMEGRPSSVNLSTSPLIADPDQFNMYSIATNERTLATTITTAPTTII